MMRGGYLHTRGMSLLEMLIACSIFTMIVISTIAVVANGRVMRERAKDRSELALLAQGELDRLRIVPLAEAAPGEQVIRREGWPANVSVTTRIETREDGYLELNVSALRTAPAGDLAVTLTGIHPGGRP